MIHQQYNKVIFELVSQRELMMGLLTRHWVFSVYIIIWPPVRTTRFQTFGWNGAPHQDLTKRCSQVTRLDLQFPPSLDTQ